MGLAADDASSSGFTPRTRVDSSMRPMFSYLVFFGLYNSKLFTFYNKHCPISNTILSLLWRKIVFCYYYSSINNIQIILVPILLIFHIICCLSIYNNLLVSSFAMHNPSLLFSPSRQTGYNYFLDVILSSNSNREQFSIKKIFSIVLHISREEYYSLHKLISCLR